MYLGFTTLIDQFGCLGDGSTIELILRELDMLHDRYILLTYHIQVIKF